MTTGRVLLERAKTLTPLLRERAGETEAQRQPCRESVDALVDAGLIRAAQPERFGGLGLDFDATFDLVAELSRGCASTGWCYSIWSSHNWIAGMFPEQAQEEYWAESPDTLSSTSFNPSGGSVVPVEGGYKVSGRWDFSSGCDAAGWVLLIGNAPSGNAPSEPLMLMLPRRDYRIDDTWFVSGLRGSGSKDIVVDDAFVPGYRSVSMNDLREGCSPGRLIHDTPNYRIPMRSILSFTLSAAVLGMAQGALDSFESTMREQVSARHGGKLAESVGLQLRLAEADAEIRAARALLHHDSREIFDRARDCRMPTLEERARYRRDQAYLARLSVQAVNRIFEAAGGRALFDSHPLQRFHRDIHAASHHVSLAWDSPAEQYGKARLGVELERPDL